MLPINRVLVVDDVREMHFEATHARTPDEAIQHLQERSWSEIWLDHDMGQDKDGNHLTIWPVVEWIEEHRPDFQRIVIHTDNAPGRHRMNLALGKLGYGLLNVNAADYSTNTDVEALLWP